MSAYYYLISSLPDLKPDPPEIKGTDIMELLGLIERNLTREDLAVYHCLLYPHDNRNLLHRIFEEYHHLEIPAYKKPSVIPEKIMKNYRRNFSYLPDYMIRFLLDNAGLFGSFSPADIETKLRSYFLDYVRRQSSEFLTTYYEWHYRLEYTIAALNKNQFEFLSEGENLDSDYLEPLPVKTAGLDAKKLQSELKPLIESGQYAAVEKLIDSCYWEFGEYWTDTFSANAVFSYTIKLLRMVRWQDAGCDTDMNRKEFLSVVGQVKADLNELNFLKS